MASEAETILVPPTGQYAAIDTKATNEINQQMLKGSKEAQQAAIDKVLKSPDKYAPPSLYVLSSVLFEQGKKDDAAFWFYAGQLRSRCDGTLCTDVSARQGTAVLNYQFGTPINQYTFQHLDMLKALVPKVVEWDKNTPHNYDRRWMALHGMGAFLSEDGKKQDVVIPKSEWEQSDEQVRKNYLEGFNQAMKQMENKKG